MTIKEVSELTGFSSYTLRYYEKIGVLQEIKRDSSGHRNFSSNDLDVLKFLSCLKKADMSVKDIIEYTELLYSNEANLETRISLLKKQELKVKEKLEDINEAYNHIQWKIDYYQNQLNRNDK